MSESRKRRARRRLLLTAGWAIFLVLAGTAASLYLACRPERLRDLIQAALAGAVQGKLAFQSRVELDPWHLGLTVRDVTLSDPDGGEVLQARSVAVLPRLGALLTGRFEPREVVLDAPHLRLSRSADGTWNLARALDLSGIQAGGTTAGGWRWPRVRVRGARISWTDASPGTGTAGTSEPEDFSLSDLTFNTSPDGRAFSFKGDVRHPIARRLSVAGTWNPLRPELLLEVKAAKLNLGGPLDRFVGAAAARELKEIGLQGFVDVEGQFLYVPGAGLSPLHLSGQLMRCQLAPAGLAFPVKGLFGRFIWRGSTIELRGVDGSFGEGRITGEAVLELDAAHELAAIDVAVRAAAIPLDHRLRGQLPPELRQVYDRFHPQGTIGLEVKARGKRSELSWQSISARLRLNGVDFALQEFPYRFQNLNGEASLEGGRLIISEPLQAHNRDAVLTVTGHCDVEVLASEGAAGEMELKARVDRLPLDEDLREALPPAGGEIWDQFQPGGEVQLVFTAERKAAAPGQSDPAAAPKGPKLSLFATCLGTRLTYAYFPYEVTGITGQLQLEIAAGSGRLTLSDLRGQHGGQIISSSGIFEWGRRDLYRIDLRCDDLGLDDSLKAAMSPNVRLLLDEFNFRGRAKTEVTIHSTHEGGTAVNVELDLLSGEVKYLSFPYPLYLAGGHLSATGEDNLRFSNVVTRQARPDGTVERPQIIFNGGLGTVGGERLLDFRFDIQELDVDDRLRNALPPDLVRFVESIGLQGTFRGELSGNFAYPTERPRAPQPGGAGGATTPVQPARPRLVYRAENVTARDAAVSFGVSLRRIDAEGRFVGGTDERGGHHFGGEVKARSATFNRLQLKGTEITFAFGREHPAVMLAREGRTPEPGTFRLDQKFLARLTPDRIRDAFQMLVKRCDLYGGNVQGFVAIDVGREHDFMGEFAAEGIQVAKAAPDVFGINDAGASGEGRGHISFTGTTGDSFSIRGKGEASIERARLVELPLFVGIWSVLFGEFSTQHYFNEVLLRYVVQDGKFRAQSPEGIAIKSTGVQLKGGGTMDFDGRLNLSLAPVFLPIKIPFLDPIIRAVKLGLAQIWVTGDISQPKVRFVTGGGLLRVPIDARPKPSDRPLPEELRGKPAPGQPLPPLPAPTPPEKKR